MKNKSVYEKYSVLISVYSKEKGEFLKASLISMITQTIQPDEIVLIKDGPLTPTLDTILVNFERQYPKLFKIISLEENVGLGKALDIGLKHCTNELVARMDSDDISLPSRCEEQLRCFNENPHLGIVGTQIDEFIEDEKVIVSSRIVPTKHVEIKKFMRRRSPFNHPTVMFKKSLVEKVGGYGKFSKKQDLDLFSRMINSGIQSMNINKSLLLFRSNEDNLSRRKSWNYCKSYIEVHYKIWRRKHCSTIDLLYVVTGQMLMLLLPKVVVKKISEKYLRTAK